MQVTMSDTNRTKKIEKYKLRIRHLEEEKNFAQIDFRPSSNKRDFEVKSIVISQGPLGYPEGVVYIHLNGEGEGWMSNIMNSQFKGQKKDLVKFFHELAAAIDRVTVGEY